MPDIKDAVKGLAMNSPLGKLTTVLSDAGDEIEDTYTAAKRKASMATAYVKGYLKAKPKKSATIPPAPPKVAAKP